MVWIWMDGTAHKREEFLYCRGYRAQALFTLNQHTSINVPCVLIEHFSMGSTVEGAFLLTRATGMHMDWEDEQGVTVFLMPSWSKVYPFRGVFCRQNREVRKTITP